MSEFYILGSDGEPIKVDDVLVWAKWFENAGGLATRRIAYDRITDTIDVSTVFLGLDHNYSDKGPPLLFETMVFRNGDEDGCWRYATKQAALDGHRSVLSKLRGADK